MAPTIEKLGGRSLTLGEGPHWDVETQSLYYVDIMGGSINRYHPATKKYTQANIGKHAAFIIPVKGAKNQFVSAILREIVLITWDGESEQVSSIKKIGEVDDPADYLQFNDAKADASGRLWLGTFAFIAEARKLVDNKAAFYSFQKAGSDFALTKHFDNVTVSNGIAINSTLKKLYYIDSPQRNVVQFDFNVELGTISNRETIFTLEKHNIQGSPDGQTIDEDGNLWVAIFGGRIIKIDPRKPETLLETIEFPVKQVTSVTFGGRDLNELYVTTGKLPNDDGSAPPGDGNGFPYVVKGLGVKGFPAENVKL